MSKMGNNVYRLEEICDIKSGKRIPKGMDYVTFKTNYPYIRARDIKEGKINTGDLIYLEENVYKKIKRYIINTGDIAITIVGASVGDIGYAQESVDGYNLTENAVRLTNFNELVDSRFLYYMLVQRQYHDFMQLIAGAAAQPKLGIYKVKRIKVVLPDVHIQKRIADVLSAYDRLIENNNKRIKLLEQMAENLYKEWFVRFRFPGYEKAVFENGIPSEWLNENLSKFGINLESGSRPKGGIDSSIGEGVPSLGAESIKGLAEFDYNNIRLIPKKFYKNLKRGKNKGNHILLYKDGAYIGKVTLFKYDFPFKEYSINEHVFFVNSVKHNYQNYLFFTLKQSAYFTLMQNLNRNAAQPGLSQEDIKKIKVLEPDNNTVKEFNCVIEPLLKKCFMLSKENQLLFKQRDMLLPRLMSGKLEV